MISLARILVATDFGEASASALAYGRAFAAMFGAKLDVLHVVDHVAARAVGADGFLMASADAQDDAEEEARGRLDRLVDEAAPGAAARAVIRVASAPAHAIIAYAREADVDLIVMGTHGRGRMTHLLMGSVAERVVRLAPCPVLTVRSPEREFVQPDALTTALLLQRGVDWRPGD